MANITPTVTQTLLQGGNKKTEAIFGGAGPLPTPTLTSTITPTPSPSSVGPVTPTPTPSVTPSSIAFRGGVIDNERLARQLVDEGLKVLYGFDGVISSDEGGGRRAVGMGGDKNTFSWYRWLTLDDGYNPSPGQLNPWSFKKWYQAGYRRFHFHCPFGKVQMGSVYGERDEGLVYQVDQFLNARDGLGSVNGQVQNQPMPWLTNDFVEVFRALATGTRGTMTGQKWQQLLTWFDPVGGKVDITVYIGSMAGGFSNDPCYNNYIARWESYIQTIGKAGTLARLKASVEPFIAAQCRIAFDACVVAPGPVPGLHVPTSGPGSISKELQGVWWQFWKWLELKVGKNRMMVEAHPFRYGNTSARGGTINPYLGYPVCVDANWFSSLCCSSNPVEQPLGPHASSEWGNVELFQATWMTAQEYCPLAERWNKNSPSDVSLEKFAFLKALYPNEFVQLDSAFDPLYKEMRLASPTCCGAGHNYGWNHLFPHIAAYMLIDKNAPLTRNDPNPASSTVKSGFMLPSTLLQILPESFPNDPRYSQQFGSKFPTKALFVEFIEKILDNRQSEQDYGTAT